MLYMHGFRVYTRENLPMAKELSTESPGDSFMYFRLSLLHSVSYYFSFIVFFFFRSVTQTKYQTVNIFPLSRSLHASANIFVFGDFNVHHVKWPNHSNVIDVASIQTFNFIVIRFSLKQGISRLVSLIILFYLICLLTSPPSSCPKYHKI